MHFEESPGTCPIISPILRKWFCFLHCKAGLHRIGIHNTSKGMNIFLTKIKIKVRHTYIEKWSGKFWFGNMCVCFISVSVNDLYIPTIGLPILLQENMWPHSGIYKSLRDTWMWKLGLRPRNSFSGNT